MSTLRAVLGIVFIGAGMVFSLLACIGVFRLKFVLNRMHAAALADTCGLFFTILGLCILSGFTFMTLKLVLILIVFWLTSPVSGHLLSDLIKNTMKKDVSGNTFQKELEK